MLYAGIICTWQWHHIKFRSDICRNILLNLTFTFTHELICSAFAHLHDAFWILYDIFYRFFYIWCSYFPKAIHSLYKQHAISRYHIFVVCLRKLKDLNKAIIIGMLATLWLAYGARGRQERLRDREKTYFLGMIMKLSIKGILTMWVFIDDTLAILTVLIPEMIRPLQHKRLS